MHCLILDPQVRFHHYYERLNNGEDVLGKHDNQTKRAICHYKPPKKCTKERHIRAGTCECFTAYKHSESVGFKNYGTDTFERKNVVIGNRNNHLPKWNARWF